MGSAQLSGEDVDVGSVIELILQSTIRANAPFAFGHSAIGQTGPGTRQNVVCYSGLYARVTRGVTTVRAISARVHARRNSAMIIGAMQPNSFMIYGLTDLSLKRLPLRSRRRVGRGMDAMIHTLSGIVSLGFCPLPFTRVAGRHCHDVKLKMDNCRRTLTVHGVH